MSDLDSEYKLLKVFSQLYVGLKAQGENAPLLGFATPLENNKAFEKRKGTVDSWARPHWRHERQEDGTYKPIEVPALTPKIIDNEAVEGFKISEEVRRTYWGGGNVVWRILDPRGFELEISSANLCRIIDSVGINPGGVIPVKCLWGRLGPNNILVPEGSTLWAKTIKDAEKMDMLSKSAKKGDYKPGDIVVTKTGDKRIYIGRLDIVCQHYSYDRGPVRPDRWSGYRDTEIAEKIRLEVVPGMYVLADIKDGEPTNITAYASLKVVEVQGHYEGTKDLIEYTNDVGTYINFGTNSGRFENLYPQAVAQRGTAVDLKFKYIPVMDPEFGFDTHGYEVGPRVDAARYKKPLWLYNDKSGIAKKLNRSTVRLNGSLKPHEAVFGGPQDIIELVSCQVTDATENLIRISLDRGDASRYTGYGYNTTRDVVKKAFNETGQSFVRDVVEAVFELNGKTIPVTL